MSQPTKTAARWFARTVAGGIIEGVAFLVAAALFIAVWTSLKGLSLPQAILLAVGSTLALSTSALLLSTAYRRLTKKEKNTVISGEQLKSDSRVYMSVEEKQTLLDERKEANQKLLEIAVQKEVVDKDLASAISERDRLAQYKWLYAEAEKDKQNIEHLIKIFIIDAQPHLEDDVPNPFIDFRFGLFNLSLYDISITNPIGGYITFMREGKEDRDGFKENAVLKAIDLDEHDVSSPIVPSRQAGGIRIRQWLTPKEAEYIAASVGKSAFWFHELRIRLNGEGIIDKRLYTGQIVTKADNWTWRSYSDPSTCFAYDTKLGFEVRERTTLLTELETLRSQIKVLTETKLWFSIKAKTSRVRIDGYGGQTRRIEANIMLRCEKLGDSILAVREFHAALLEDLPSGEKETLIERDHFQVLWDEKDNLIEDAEDGWIVDRPATPYRKYQFSFVIKPEFEASLSREHFLRVDMFAIGQDEPVSITFSVNNWDDARRADSGITLRD